MQSNKNNDKSLEEGTSNIQEEHVKGIKTWYVPYVVT